MDKLEINPELTRFIVKPDWSDDDVLVWMVLLHLNKIAIQPGVRIDELPASNKPTIFEPETRRGAAECVAKIWPAGDPRSDYVYWYSLYNLRTPFEDITEVPLDMRHRMARMKEHLLANPMVADVYLET